MSDRNQYGYRRTQAPRQASMVTPGNILKRPETQQTSGASSLHDTLSYAQGTDTQTLGSGKSKRPVSFSRRPTFQNGKPRAASEKAASVADAQNRGAAKSPAKTGYAKKWQIHPLKRLTQSIFNFIDRHYKGIGIVLTGIIAAGYLHAIGEQNEDKRARLNNEPLTTLKPTSKKMENGRNTAFKNWKGSISAITGGANIDTLSTKDGRRPDKSYIVEGVMAGKTRAYLGDTLIRGGGNLRKTTYAEKPVNPDQAHVLEVVDLNELTKRESDLPKSTYQESPTAARLDTSKQDKAAREAAQKAAAERMVQQKWAQRSK